MRNDPSSESPTTPTNEFVETDSPIDLKEYLAISIEELDLTSETKALLREHRLINLGKLVSVNREKISEMVNSNEVLRQLDAQIHEHGLSFGMQFLPCLVTNQERLSNGEFVREANQRKQAFADYIKKKVIEQTEEPGANKFDPPHGKDHRE